MPSSCSFSKIDSLVKGFITYSSAPASSACAICGHLGLGGDHDDPGRRAVGRLAHRRDELDAGHLGHVPVDEHERRDRGPPSSRSSARRPLAASVDLHAQLAQHPAEDQPHRPRVVDHQARACICHRPQPPPTTASLGVEHEQERCVELVDAGDQAADARAERLGYMLVAPRRRRRRPRPRRRRPGSQPRRRSGRSRAPLTDPASRSARPRRCRASIAVTIWPRRLSRPSTLGCGQGHRCELLVAEDLLDPLDVDAERGARRRRTCNSARHHADLPTRRRRRALRCRAAP